MKTKQEVFELFCIHLLELFVKEVKEGNETDTRFRVILRSSKVVFKMLTNAVRFILKDYEENVYINEQLIKKLSLISGGISERNVKIIAKKSLSLLSSLSYSQQMKVK